MTFLALVIWLIIIGAAAFLVNKAPFIEAEYKAFIKYVFLIVGVVIVVMFLAGVLGGDTGFNLKLR